MSRNYGSVVVRNILENRPLWAGRLAAPPWRACWLRPLPPGAGPTGPARRPGRKTARSGASHSGYRLGRRPGADGPARPPLRQPSGRGRNSGRSAAHVQRQQRNYGELAQFLQKDHGCAVLVPDLRGHGGSTKFQNGGQLSVLQPRRRRNWRTCFNTTRKLAASYCSRKRTSTSRNSAWWARKWERS